MPDIAKFDCSFPDLQDPARRAALTTLAGASALLIPAAGLIVPAAAEGPGRAGQQSAGEETPATEDLMREHGVLRRALIAYGEVANQLDGGHARDLDPNALADAARLFREFGENYHERTLEEQQVFPEVIRFTPQNSALVDVLLVQHQRGREITDYIERIAGNGRLAADAGPLASTLRAMLRMYEAHATWEDTVLFPAWKKSISKEHLDELSERFEDIEHQRFGKDGFDDAVARMARIEQALGLAGLERFTAPSPPSQQPSNAPTTGSRGVR